MSTVLAAGVLNDAEAQAAMLPMTFQHLPGIGPKKEFALWRSGVLTWDDFERRHQIPLFDRDLGPLQDSRHALLKGDAAFFAVRLPRHEHYRLALTFPSQVLFLDLETTGLSLWYDAITLIGWSIDSAYKVLMVGDDDHALRADLARAKVVVTFNGSLFDLPFLRRHLPDVTLPAAHVDLRFLAKPLGMRGGQKAVERALGIARPGFLADLDGKVAPVLWHRYRFGDMESLRLLVSYNRADVYGLTRIFDAIVERRA